MLQQHLHKHAGAHPGRQWIIINNKAAFLISSIRACNLHAGINVTTRLLSISELNSPNKITGAEASGLSALSSELTFASAHIVSYRLLLVWANA